MSLVEELFGGLDDRRHDARPADDAARGAHGPVADTRRDRAYLEGELGSSGESVSPLVHRRRACVCGLSSPGDPVALDAEGSEYDSEREIQRLENGALLDVELEIGGRRFELIARFEGVVEIDSVTGERVRQRDAVPVGQLTQLVLIRHRACGCARAEEAPAETRSLLVSPIYEADRDRRRAVFRDPAQYVDARQDIQTTIEPASIRDGVDVAPDQDG